MTIYHWRKILSEMIWHVSITFFSENKTEEKCGKSSLKSLYNIFDILLWRKTKQSFWWTLKHGLEIFNEKLKTYVQCPTMLMTKSIRLFEFQSPWQSLMNISTYSASFKWIILNVNATLLELLLFVTSLCVKKYWVRESKNVYSSS